MFSRTVPGRACSTPACRLWPTRLRRPNVATLRYQFPYMERGSRRVDSPAVAHAAVRAAVAEARRRLPALPLFAGGRSYGGRMTSQAQAISPLDGVRGLAFVAFPLHRRARPAWSGNGTWRMSPAG
ncbi:alpha/beta family hydrolase [Paraburkholderia sp. EG304]|uniref:alpha/beta family hydrolase n=1 Tax=Paraburkholderia sp. EG304 TaxID=3237015 RepID=UPI00397C539E